MLHETSRTRRLSEVFSLLSLPLLYLPLLLIVLFSMPSSMSGQVDPRNRDWVELPRIFLLDGDSLRNDTITSGQQVDVYPLGDIDHSGTDDFAVRAHVRRLNGDRNTRLLIYKGYGPRIDPNSIEPDVLALPEFLSRVKLVAVGDWDGDSYIDLCVDVRLESDTSGGNKGGFWIFRTVIFWNDGTGHYSIGDTSRLQHIPELGTDIMGGFDAVVFDYSGDGVDDLLFQGGDPLVNNQRVDAPDMYLYYGGKGRRWGRNGARSTPDWHWWTVPEHDRVQLIDQDCDNRPDLALVDAFYLNAIYVYYGGSDYDDHGVPDTNDVEVIYLKGVNGNGASRQGGISALFQDITSDGIVDLTVAAEDAWFRTYVGEPGRRITEIYGTGNDPADPDGGYPNRRPWALTPMPSRLMSGWSTPSRLYPMGDVNNDGYNDLWTAVNRKVVVYSTGPEFDALIDGHYDYGGEIDNVIRIGDLTGSGVTMYALLNSIAISSIVQIFSATAVPNSGVRHPIPAGHSTTGLTPNRCNSTVGVKVEPKTAPDSLDLSVESR